MAREKIEREEIFLRNAAFQFSFLGAATLNTVHFSQTAIFPANLQTVGRRYCGCEPLGVGERNSCKVNLLSKVVFQYGENGRESAINTALDWST